MDTKDVLDIIRENNKNIFVTVFSDDIEVPFSLPSTREAKRYKFLLDNAATSVIKSEIYLDIFNRFCCDKNLLNSDKIDIPAGIGETVAQLIMWLSGYGEEPLEYTNSLMDENRKWTNSIIQTMRRTICSVFKAYTFEYLDTLDHISLVEIFIQAEKVLLEAGIIEKEFKLSETKEQMEKVNVDKLIEDQKKGLRKVNAPPEAKRLDPGQAPPSARNTRRPRRR